MTPRRAFPLPRRVTTLALAVLALAASAWPAAAQRVLVSNIGQTKGGFHELSSHHAAQGFTTGSHAAGYTLSSVDISFGQAPSGVTVKIATGLPSAVTDVATLSNPSSFSTGNNTFTAPANTTLSPGTKYFVVVSRVSTGRLDLTQSDAEDSGGLTGWSIADVYQYSTTGAGGSWTAATANAALIRVNGSEKTVVTVPGAPEQPGAPTVEKGPTSGSLKVSWTAPANSGTITDYDLRYFKGTADPSVESDWVTEGPLAPGLPHPDSAFLATVDTVTALLANSAYRVQVRAANSNGEGSWSTSGSATTATAPSTNHPVRTMADADPNHENPQGTCEVVTNPTTPLNSVTATAGSFISLNLVTRGTEKTEWPSSCRTGTGNSEAPVFDDRDAEQLLFALDYTVPDNVRVMGGTPRIVGNRVYLQGAAGLSHTDLRIEVTATDPHGASASAPVLFAVRTFAGTSAPSLASVSGKTFAVNEAITSFALPAATGGDTSALGTAIPNPYIYAVSGLPPGLSFNAETRTVSGTPTTVGGYTVTYQADDFDGHYAARSGGDATDIADTAVQTFNIEVTRAGSSPPVGAPGAPAQPATPTVEKGPKSGSLKVSWTAPDSGSAAITDYDLRYFKGTADPASETDWVTEGPGAPGLPHPDSTFLATADTVTGLLANSTYRVQVRAANTNGEGPWSSSGSQTTATAPSTNHAPVTMQPDATGKATCTVNSAGNNADHTVSAPTGTAVSIILGGSPSATALPIGCTDESDVRPVFHDTDGDTLSFTFDYTLPDNVLSIHGDGETPFPRPVPGGSMILMSLFGKFAVAYQHTDIRVTATATDPHGASKSVVLVFNGLTSAGSRTPTFASTVSGQSYPVNEAIADLVLPAATGGDTVAVSRSSYFYEVSGLPPGLSFNDETRTISGTPTTAGSYRVTYKAEDIDGNDSGDTPDPMDTAVQTFDIAVRGTAPVIQSLGIVSRPSLDRTGDDGVADTYGLGETIAIEVEFTEDVVVTGGNSNVLLWLDLGADDSDLSNSRRVVNLHSHEGNTLRFEYTVATGDADADGVWVQTASATNTQAVFLVSPATIKDADSNDAVRTKSGLPTSGDANQKVDGSFSPLPKFEGAEVNGSTLTLTFTGKLHPESPAASQFTVSGTTPAKTVTSAAFRSADSTKVDLTLSAAVGRGETGIAVSYAKGADTDNPLRVSAANAGQRWPLANFANRPVRNVTGPSVTGAAVNGTTLTLTFDAALKAGTAPAATRFAVTGTSETTTVTAAAIPAGDPTKVNLTLSPRVGAAETGIAVAYTAGTDTNPLQDANGNKVADFSGRTVTNLTPPVVTDASVNRKTVTLTFDSPVNTAAVPDVGRFSVSGKTVSYVQFRLPNSFLGDTFASGEKLELWLTSRVEIGETAPTVSYAKGDDANPLKEFDTDIEVADFTGREVTNATQPPTVTFVGVYSTPAIDVDSDNTAETYGLGELIRVRVVFDERVTVDASGGTPRLKIDLKSETGGERWAEYERKVGSGTAVFAYAVTAADTSTAGIAVVANSLELNGSAIRSAEASVTTDANLAHTGLGHDADHKVNGGRTTAPVPAEEGILGQVGEVDGSTLTVRFNKNLDATSAPAGSAFTLKVSPKGFQPYTVAGTGTASISGSEVTVTLASAVTEGEGVQVSYAKPSANPLRGAGGGEVANFSLKTVENVTPAAGNSPPTFPPETPATLQVRENSPAGTLVGTIAARDPDGDRRTYTLVSTVSGGTDHESFAIGANTGRIAVAAGATLNYEAKPSYAVTVQVTDSSKNTPGPGDDFSIDAEHELTIRLVNVAEPPSAPGAPAVTRAGTATSLSVSWSAPSNRGARAVTDYDLRYYAGSSDPSNPSDWIEEGEPNGPPNPGSTTSAVISGLSPNTAYVVQVRAQGDGESPWSASGGATTGAGGTSTPAGPPTRGTVSADGATVTLEFAEALDDTSVPAPGDFTVTLAPASSASASSASDASSEPGSGGRSAPARDDHHRVTLVTIRGSALDLTVSPPVPAGRAAVVSYTKGSNPLRTASGSEVPDFGFTATAPAAPPPPPPPPPPPSAIDVTVEGGSAVEGSAVTFTVRLSQASAADVVLGWSTGRDASPGARQATPEADYRPVADGRVTVPAGETEATFPVTTLVDFDEEGDETFAVTIVGIGLPEGVTVAAATAVGTVVDDPLLPPPVRDTISVEGGTAVEGEPVTFTARLSSSVGSDVVLRWFTSADYTYGARRATPGTDYEAVRDGRVRIAAGSTSATFAVATARDTVEEGAETFRVIIAEVALPEGAGIVHSTAVGTIGDYTPPPNAAPSFESESYAFDLEENTDGSAGSVRLGAVSATDPDGDELTYALAAGDSTRFAVGVRNGAVLYVGPGEDFEAEPNVYALTVRASDPAGESAEAAVVVTVVNVNERPAAADDAATTDEDVAVEIDVLANDADVEGTALRVSSVTEPAHGTAEVTSAGGGILYTPDANWHGTDSFVYEIDDGDGGTASAAVEVTVVPVNDAPEAAGDAASTDEDGSVEIDVLANDTDIDGDSLRVSSVSEAANGTVAVTARGGVVYTPAANWHGTDSFDYEIDDGAGGTASASVEVTVLPVNDVPEAAADAATTDEDAAVEIDVLANDTDADGDSLRVSSVSAPSNGTVAVTAAAGILYTPAANWYGTDSFTYEVDDGNGGTASAEVEVAVLPVNDAPEAFDDAASAEEDGTVEIDVLANDTDIDGDALRVSSVSAPSNGTAAIAGSGVRYTPAANWHGTDSFTYEADDGNGGTAEASVEVTVSPVNDVPEAADDAATTNEDEPVTVNVLANDTDLDGDGLRVSSVTAPANGTAEVAAGGVRYTPAANWHGTDSFAYEIDDGNGGTASASVEVTVLPVNDAPAAVGTIPSQSLDEGGEPASIELSPFFADTDGDALEYRASSSNPSVVEASVAGSVLTLVPAGYGTAEVTVTAADAGGLTAMQTVSVGVSDRAAHDVVSHALAGMARSHLASARMTLGRRTSASRSEASGLTLLGRKVPLGTGAARAEAERMWSGWLSGITSRAHAQAAPGAGAPMAAPTAATGGPAAAGFGMPGVGGTAMTSTGAPMGAGMPTAATGGPMGAGASRGAVGATSGSGDGMSLGELFRFGDLVPRFQGGRDPLRGSEFQFAFGGGQEAGGGGGGLRFQLWGQGDVQTFKGAPSEASDYDGELQTGYVGVDTWLSDHWMLGLAVARSRGTGDWRAGRANGSLETRLVAVHPYLQWSSGGTSLWATAGAGWGDADNVRDSGRTETSGLGLRLGLVELRRRLAAAGGFEFSLRADAGWAELATDAGTETLDGQTAAVNQLRFGTELSQQIRLGGLTLAPFGEAHVRRDGGAGQPGTGLELSGGLRAQAGFLRIDAQGRMLAVHSVAGYEERGLGLTLSLGNPGGEGLSLSMSPRWGDAIAGGDALWQEQIYSRYAPAAPADGGEPAANTRDPWALDIRGGYGLRIPGGRLLNWSASLNHSTTGPRFTLGAQLGLGSGGASAPLGSEGPATDRGSIR